MRFHGPVPSIGDVLETSSIVLGLLFQRCIRRHDRPEHVRHAVRTLEIETCLTVRRVVCRRGRKLRKVHRQRHGMVRLQRYEILISSVAMIHSRFSLDFHR